MRFRSNAVAIGLAAVLLLAGCASTAPGSADPIPAEESPRVIEHVEATGSDATGRIDVGGSAAVSTTPEEARIRVGVETTDRNASDAREELARRVQRMRSALREIGIEDDQVRTEHYDINQDYRSLREEDRPVTYRAQHSFRITVRDLEQTGTVIDTAVNNGANRINGVEFTISSERRGELRTRALEQAMADAREEAETLAASANLTITGVESIQTSNVQVSGYQRDVALEATPTAGGADTTIDTGDVTVSAQVQVRYNVTPA
jgi:uncharacterized protein YggE